MYYVSFYLCFASARHFFNMYFTRSGQDKYTWCEVLPVRQRIAATTTKFNLLSITFEQKDHV